MHLPSLQRSLGLDQDLPTILLTIGLHSAISHLSTQAYLLHAHDLEQKAHHICQSSPPHRPLDCIPPKTFSTLDSTCPHIFSSSTSLTHNNLKPNREKVHMARCYLRDTNNIKDQGNIFSLKLISPVEMLANGRR